MFQAGMPIQAVRSAKKQSSTSRIDSSSGKKDTQAVTIQPFTSQTAQSSNVNRG